MTRKELINKSSIECAFSDQGLDVSKPDYIRGFKAGAKWADEHPESPWIKFRERKPDTMCLVLVYHDEEAFTAYFKEFDDGSYWRMK